MSVTARPDHEEQDNRRSHVPLLATSANFRYRQASAFAWMPGPATNSRQRKASAGRRITTTRYSIPIPGAGPKLALRLRPKLALRPTLALCPTLDRPRLARRPRRKRCPTLAGSIPDPTRGVAPQPRRRTVVADPRRRTGANHHATPCGPASYEPSAHARYLKFGRRLLLRLGSSRSALRKPRSR